MWKSLKSDGKKGGHPSRGPGVILAASLCGSPVPPQDCPHHREMHRTEKSSVPDPGENLPSFCKPRNRGAAAPQPCSNGKRDLRLNHSPPHPPTLRTTPFPSPCVPPPRALHSSPGAASIHPPVSPPPVVPPPPKPAPDRKLETTEWLDRCERGVEASPLQGDPAAKGRLGGSRARCWKRQGSA